MSWYPSVICFSTSDGSNGINYFRMYAEIEALIDFYSWTVPEAKKLTVRERRHWFQRVKFKRESTKS